MSEEKKRNESKISFYYFTSLKSLHSKYNSFENSYELICINNLIYTENCHIVARFKDFLYYDDSTEFLNKLFPKNVLFSTLKKIYEFYTRYCKVFPNYMILPENEFLYRNLRKKQKLIDQFNEIKKEEEENRNHLKLKKNKENENDYILFNKKDQDSIEMYKPSFTQSSFIMMDYINFTNKEKKEANNINDNSITISLNYNNTKVNDLNDFNSSGLTLVSITNIMNQTPKKVNLKESGKIEFTPVKPKKQDGINKQIKNEGLNNKKYISNYQNYNENINLNNNINSCQKKENKIKYKNNIIDTTKKNKNNITQSKTSNNLFISSITKTNKEKQNKSLVKGIKSNITKKKLFTTTEKTVKHKNPIYNYKNTKNDKNTNSISSNKHKKNYPEIILVSMKSSISPSNSKINAFKLKLIDKSNSNTKKGQSKTQKYNNNNNSNNNLSNITKNKIKKSFGLNDNNNDHERVDKSNNDKTLNKNKSNYLKNGNGKKVKEIMGNYKNILKTKKTNHLSHDINKNSALINNKKNINNLTEKNIQKNTSNGKIIKLGQHNKNVSPGNKKDILINGKIPIQKTPVKSGNKITNKYQNIITKTKETTQLKIQNYIQKILEKSNNKKNYFINHSKIKQNLV